MCRLMSMALAAVFVVLSLGACASDPQPVNETKQYQQTLTFYVGLQSDGLALSGAYINALTNMENILESCLVVIESRAVLSEVSSQCGGRYSYEQLRDMLTTRGTETNIFTVTVTGTDASQVQQISEVIVRVFPEKMSEIVADDVVIRVVDVTSLS